jgi:hypothetical protein
VLVGFGLCAAKSANHCIDGPSAHIAGWPITVGFPGMQVKPLDPSRKTTVCPCASLATIFANRVISGGPAEMARAICASVVSPVSITVVRSAGLDREDSNCCDDWDLQCL